LAERFAGDAIAANLLMLGYCYQLGLLPLSLWSLERAIELNGTAAERNKKIFHMGRLAAHRPSLFERNGASRHRVTAVEPTAAELIADRATRLVDYQDESYADRFREIMAHVVQTEANLGPSRDRFSRAVAISLYKLMAYKDEYEVARLYTRPEFRAGLEEQFESFSKVKIHLAPPLLSRGKDAAGRPKKREFGPWVFHLFHVLARLKRLRGTPLDLLGLTAERRMERGLIGRYETIVRELCEALDAGGYDLAVEIASVPQLIRGFGPIKEANARYALEEWEKLLEKWRSNVSLRAAA
jgi:indolepyruvate ferredoxin oxidoreductase